MTTSLLFHSVGVRSYSLLLTEYREGPVYAPLRKRRYYHRCTACHHPLVTLEGCPEVKVRTLPIGTRSVFLILHLHRLRCCHCGKLKQDSRNLTVPRKSDSFALARRGLCSSSTSASTSPRGWMINEGLDEVCRMQQNRLQSQGKQVLKGGRYLLLRSRYFVEKVPADSSRLDTLLCANDTLHRVYLLKEELRILWEQPTQLQAH